MSLAGPYLASLLSKTQTTQTYAAAVAGVSMVSLNKRIHGALTIRHEVVLKAARAAGASPEEVAHLAVLDALDRRVLPLPLDADEHRVRQALAILDGSVIAAEDVALLRRVRLTPDEEAALGRILRAAGVAA